MIIRGGLNVCREGRSFKGENLLFIVIVDSDRVCVMTNSNLADSVQLPFVTLALYKFCIVAYIP